MAAPQQGTDPTAVIGRRVVATLIDGAVIIAPGIAIASSQMEYLTRERVGARFDDFCDLYSDQHNGACIEIGDRVYFNDDTTSAAPFLGLGIAILVLVVLQGLTGWTVGKLLTGLRTVKEDGTPPGIGKALIRWLLLVIDGLPCIPLVGFITALTTQGHRRVGDMAAKTFVVRRKAAGHPILVPGLTTAPAAPMAYGAPSIAPTPNVPPQAPQWDAARGTYIQWDAGQGRWLQWDEATRTWSPIAGQ